MCTKIISLNDSNFEKNIKNLKDQRLILIDFWAPWCNPCKILSPILEEIAINNNSVLLVAKLNVDDNPITTKKYNIRGIPTLLLFRNDVLLERKVGILSKNKLQEFLNTYLL